MKKGFLVLISVVAVMASWAQNAVVKGNVRDARTGEAVSGAHIWMKEAGKGAISDFLGAYRIKNLPGGKQSIRVSYVGYETKTAEVNLTENKTSSLDFVLEPRAYETEEAVVTGTRVEISRQNVPLAVSVITRDEIENSSESNILPVIGERIPGVFITERGVTGFGVAGGAAGSITMRGVGGSPNTQVLVLIDGHPQYMGLFGHPLPDAYVASDAERVEVIKGPASILYGSNAMGGVINIITNKQQKEGFAGHARLQYGSYNTQKYSAGAGYKKDRFSLFASFNHDQTDGHRENSGFDINNGYLKAAYDISSSIKVTADASVADFMAYDPGPARNIDSSYLLQEHWADIVRGKVAVSFENRFRKSEGALKTFYNFGEHKLYDGFHSTDRNAGITFYQALRLFSNNVITVGLDYKNLGGMAENTEAMMGQGIIFTDTAINEVGSYVFVQHSFFSRLLLTAGLRVDNSEISGTELVPQFGATWGFNERWSFRASASKGFRNPTIRELFMWNSANPDLKPERMWNYEAGVSSKFLDSKLAFDLTGFYAEGENLIVTEGQYPAVKNVNSGSFFNHGFELSAKYNINKSLVINSGYSFLQTNKVIPASPKHQFYGGIDAALKNFGLYVGTNYIDGLYTDASGDHVESYLLLNARLSYKPLKYMQLFVKGENLLDTDYEINYDYPMPGITIMGGIVLKYEKN